MTSLHAYSSSGLTLYAVLLDASGQAWNGTTFEAISAPSWASYDIAMTEAAAGIYLATMPAVAAGVYSYVVYERAGGSPATSDAQRGAGWLAWDGSAEIVPLAPQSVRDALLRAPSGGVPAAGSVDALLSAVVGAGGGTGLYTDTLLDGSTPLDGVRVTLSTDAGGSHRVYETFSDALGVFVLRPDPGTYYRFLELAGYTFAQGVQVEVDAT